MALAGIVIVRGEAFHLTAIEATRDGERRHDVKTLMLARALSLPCWRRRAKLVADIK